MGRHQRAERRAAEAADAEDGVEGRHDRRAPARLDVAREPVHGNIERAVGQAEREGRGDQPGRIGRKTWPQHRKREAKSGKAGRARDAEARRQQPGRRHGENRPGCEAEQDETERAVGKIEALLQ